MTAGSIDRSALDEFVSTFAAEHPCATIAWGIVHDGALEIAGAIGDTHEHKVYRIASMTKSFSAAATLLLRDEGAFQLDDPICRLVPELESLRGPTADAAPITIRDLLSMTSGFVTDDAWADRNLDLSDDTFDTIVAAGPVFAQPTGTEFEYSNFGYAVLGRVVHRVTGVRLQDHVSERLLRPLDMARTTWVMPPHDDWARPMRWLDDDYTEELTPLDDGLIAPMGGIWTTVSDLAKWIGWLDDAFPARDGLDDGPLSRASRREMQTSQQYVGMRSYGEIRYATSYCLGLRVLHHPQRGSIVSHSGGLPGYGANMSWRLGRRLGTIALSNTTYAPMTELGIRMLEQVSDQLDPTPSRLLVTTIVDDAANRLVDLLNGWDDSVADRLFSDNVSADDSWTRRRAAAESHLPLTISSIRPINDARARVWCIDSHGCKVKITFSLAPSDPSTIQKYEISPLPNS
jgi:CubicO group peptidase (beta-lactamase class C family)